MEELEALSTHVSVKLVTLSIMQAIGAVHWVHMGVSRTLHQFECVTENELHFKRRINRAVNLKCLMSVLIPKDDILAWSPITGLLHQLNDGLK